MAKQTKLTAPTIVRTRRAYFDCRFGQLHVRTAFPTTGGFNEGVTLFCLHPNELSSRMLELAAARPELVRRLVLVAAPPIDGLPVIKQESLVLRIKLGVGDDSQWTKAILPEAKFIDLAEYDADMFDAAPKTLAKQIGAFLKAKEPI